MHQKDIRAAPEPAGVEGGLHGGIVSADGGLTFYAQIVYSCTMTGRARRQQIIIEVLQRQPVDSQEELRQTLAARGIEVTQATLSRDLRELGAMKTPRGYQLPHTRGHSSAEAARAGGPLGRALASFVTAVEPACNVIVLKTGPGHAQIVALEIDRANLAGVVGCLAGDDTVFAAMSSAHRAKELSRELMHLAGLGIADGVAQ